MVALIVFEGTNALLGVDSSDNIWWSLLQVVNMPSTALLLVDEERGLSNRASLLIAGDGAKRTMEGRSSGMRVARRGAGERSMLEDVGMARLPSQLKALGRSMLR